MRGFNDNQVRYSIYIVTSYGMKYEETFKDRESAKERLQEVMGALKAKIQRGIKIENTQHS